MCCCLALQSHGRRYAAVALFLAGGGSGGGGGGRGEGKGGEGKGEERGGGRGRCFEGGSLQGLSYLVHGMARDLR